ncbi:uncharacterized protein V1510DRAFT_246595 [Dipodascopsis tothii]|uniref:uncharacterized protein n=1 Tax=Dipodascopsis tothii TaxID=44089 RepID=UPI0034CDE83D
MGVHVADAGFADAFSFLRACRAGEVAVGGRALAVAAVVVVDDADGGVPAVFGEPPPLYEIAVAELAMLKTTPVRVAGSVAQVRALLQSAGSAAAVVGTVDGKTKAGAVVVCDLVTAHVADVYDKQHATAAELVRTLALVVDVAVRLGLDVVLFERAPSVLDEQIVLDHERGRRRDAKDVATVAVRRVLAKWIDSWACGGVGGE